MHVDEALQYKKFGSEQDANISSGHVSVRGFTQVDSLHLMNPKGQVERVGHRCCDSEHEDRSDSHRSSP